MNSFDALLKQKATVLRRPSGPASNYGNKPKLPNVTIAENVPCRVTVHRARPYQDKSEKSLAADKRLVVFMRPLAGLTVHDWLRVAGYPDMDITIIHDPSGVGHHWQLTVELLYP